MRQPHPTPAIGDDPGRGLEEPPVVDVVALAARVADAYAHSLHEWSSTAGRADTDQVDEACGDAITEAVAAVFGENTPETVALLLLTARIHTCGESGAELAAGHLEQSGPHASPGRVAFMTAHVRLLADVLAASGVDLLDEGRTVAGLYAYADVFAASPLHEVPAARGPRPDPSTLSGALTLMLPSMFGAFAESVRDGRTQPGGGGRGQE